MLRVISVNLLIDKKYPSSKTSNIKKTMNPKGLFILHYFGQICNEFFDCTAIFSTVFKGKLFALETLDCIPSDRLSPLYKFFFSRVL